MPRKVFRRPRGLGGRVRWYVEALGRQSGLSGAWRGFLCLVVWGRGFLLVVKGLEGFGLFLEGRFSMSKVKRLRHVPLVALRLMGLGTVEPKSGEIRVNLRKN